MMDELSFSDLGHIKDELDLSDMQQSSWEHLHELDGRPALPPEVLAPQFPPIPHDDVLSLLPALMDLPVRPDESFLPPLEDPRQAERLEEESDLDTRECGSTFTQMEEDFSPDSSTPESRALTPDPHIAPGKKASRASSRANSSSSTVSTSQPKSKSRQKKRGSQQQPKVASPEEKRNMTNDELVEWKKDQRLKRNRASAQLSRERRKKYVTQLEGRVEELTKAYSTLSKQMQAVKSENKRLRQRLGLSSNEDPLSPISACSSTQSPEEDDTASSCGERSPKRSRPNTMTFFAFALCFGFIFSWLGLPSLSLRASDLSAPLSIRPVRRMMMDVKEDRALETTSIEVEDSAELNLLKTSPVSPDRNRALVPRPSQDLFPALEQTQDQQRLDNLHVDKILEINGSLDLYREKESAVDFDTLSAAYAVATSLRLQKLLQDANITLSGDELYLLCPYATSLHSDGILTSNSGLTTNSNSTLLSLGQSSGSKTGKRLRKAFPPRSEEKGSTSIMLWVPTSSLESSILNMNRSVYEQMEQDGRSSTGLSQITCQVSHVQPVHSRAQSKSDDRSRLDDI
eukprot:gb/GEZN01001835.1/.p1 GENE.gb/GEZN01001835.1/~~gb/GEZN01001835.1/.p1  ORF type:complete len:572 (+),score=88.78 gb/GEZN01001835.1/:642-2357(+)